jgi:predicted phosphodiesterase
MTIFIVSDIHGRFDHHIIEAVKRHRPDLVVSLGGLQPQRPLHEQLVEILEFTKFHRVHGNLAADADCRVGLRGSNRRLTTETSTGES